MTMPPVFAGDPAPQQLTAPCRKYSGRSHPPLEQALYRLFFKHLRAQTASTLNRIVSAITVLVAPISARRAARLRLIAALAAAWLMFGTDGRLTAQVPAHSQVPGTTEGKVTGRIVDAATADSLAGVLVLDEGSNRSVVSNSEGRFEIALPAGSRKLTVSIVGYGLVRREVAVPTGTAIDLLISLTGGTGTYSETVTVTPERFRRAEPVVAAQQVLDSADLQNLRGVLADDPMRAIQALPGVATGDDLRSEFSVRGSDFAHTNFTLDGFSSPYVLHTVRAVEDRSSSGSVAMINSDVLESVTLSNGGYPQRVGNRTGPSVDFRLRDGSRDRTHATVAVSGTSASFVAEGPLRSERRGSWLVSARQSYLNLVLDRLVDNQVSFGFTDAQGRLVYDLTPRQHVDLTVIAGRSRLKEPEDEIGTDDLYLGDNASALAIGGWRLTLPRAWIAARVLSATNQFRNETLDGTPLDKGHDVEVAGRLDGAWQALGRMQVEAGALVEQTRESRQRQRPISGAGYVTVNDYTGSATRTGAYALAQWQVTRALTVAPGARVDYFSLTEDSTASPWIQAEWRVRRGLTVRGGAGRYQQFPDFEQVLGAWGATMPSLERAEQYDLGVEQQFGSMRAQVTVYDRQEQDFMRRAGADTRLVGTRVVRGVSTARYETRLDGYARGVEFLLERRSPTGLSGWISYSYGRNRYDDFVSGESYWGDLDQRHTVNLYGFYRLGSRTSFSAKLRAGSNTPAPGYFGESVGTFFVTDERNGVRLPSYARLDLRANRTFSWSHRRLTLFAEVINVLNRENVRYRPPSIDTRTREVRRLFETLIPVVPSAGVLVEF
jgi:TonB dependent receptor-like, beta-barrel/CarboxypepD_reg-like domain/TonB-dependent Receptor Plug Domain